MQSLFHSDFLRNGNIVQSIPFGGHPIQGNSNNQLDFKINRLTIDSIEQTINNIEQIHASRLQHLYSQLQKQPDKQEEDSAKSSQYNNTPPSSMISIDIGNDNQDTARTLPPQLQCKIIPQIIPQTSSVLSLPVMQQSNNNGNTALRPHLTKPIKQMPQTQHATQEPPSTWRERLSCKRGNRNQTEINL